MPYSAIREVPRLKLKKKYPRKNNYLRFPFALNALSDAHDHALLRNIKSRIYPGRANDVSYLYLDLTFAQLTETHIFASLYLL